MKRRMTENRLRRAFVDVIAGVLATTAGSGGAVYRQDIAIVIDGGEVDIDAGSANQLELAAELTAFGGDANAARAADACVLCVCVYSM